jgi:transposase InsO family protein
MTDRSSRPHHCPRRIPARIERRIIKVRVLRRWGPARIAFFLRLVPSTVHRVLARFGLARLAHLDRATALPVRRYERATPGELVHVDIKKLGNIPDGGGHRFVGRQQGKMNRERTAKRTGQRNHRYEPRPGTSYLHTVIDDHSRVAYVELHADEKTATVTGFMERALAFYAKHGIDAKRVMTDNAFAYVHGRAFRELLARRGIRHLTTEPYRPRTNGKVERFHQTMAREWAYGLSYRSHRQRNQALPHWLEHYNLRRPHSSLGDRPPISRVHNVCG